ncbi:hypothetical protein Tco_1323952, partial [Tanacetum coccineum]
MGKPTLEEYMIKTREGYGSGIARPEIDEKAQLELNGQFLKELRDNTFSGSDNKDANEHIKKILEIQAWELFKELLLRCPQHYLIDMKEVILNYKGLDVPTKQFLDSKGVIPSMKDADAKKAIQDMANHSQKWHNGTSTRCRSTETSNGLAAIEAQLNNLGREIKKMNEKVHVAQVGSRMTISRNSSRILPKEQWKPFVSRVKTNNGRITKQVYGRIYKRNEENSNLIKEIRASTDAAIRNQGASVKALEIQIEQISK